MKITKKISHELNLNQISPLAKSMTLIQAFVSETQAPSDSEEEEPQMEAEEEEEEEEEKEEEKEEEPQSQEEQEEQEMEEVEEEQEAEQAMEVALVNNAQHNIQVEIPAVKLIEPLQMLVGQEVKRFGRVEVPGRGKMLLTYDIIMGINYSTQNAAGNFFRELSDDKKNEVSSEALISQYVSFSKYGPIRA